MSKAYNHALKASLLTIVLLMSPAASLGQFLLDPISPTVSLSQNEAAPAGSAFNVVVDFEMEPGVKLYRDKLSFEWAELKGVEFLETSLPQGKKVPDELSADKNAMIEVYEGSVRMVARMRSTGTEGDSITIRGDIGYQGCTDEVCYPPGKKPFSFELSTAAALPGEAASETAEVEKGQPPAKKRAGAFWLILMAFAAGVAVSLTPCVYPMIPITAAIIGGTKQKGKLGALLSSLVYVFGLSLTYSLLGLLVASGGARVRTALTSPWVLVPIAGIFTLLALSMFEVITIQFQPKFANKWQRTLSGKGNILAVFVMGIISGLVAGPCISAPLAAILIDIAKQGDRLLGFLRLFALAWGMGIVLIIAGTFTSALPQAGEWTLLVKNLFGFIMLWAAGYFLAPVIGGTAYRIVTAVVLIAGAVFLGCFDTLTKESRFAERLKRVLGIVAVLFAAYLFMGTLMKRQQIIPAAGPEKAGYERAETDTGAVTGPFQMATYEQVQKAIGSGQPAVLDFYADWCTYCKKLDKETFSDARVGAALKEFQTLKIDIEKEPRLEREYGILGVPTIVFIGGDGKEIETLRQSGFRDAAQFLQILKQVKMQKEANDGTID